jgi:hypothetical protein
MKGRSINPMAAIALAGGCCLALSLIVLFVLFAVPASWSDKQPSWVWLWLVLGAFLVIFLLVILVAGCEGGGPGGPDEDDVGVSFAFAAFFLITGVVVIGVIIAFSYFAVRGKPVPPDPWISSDSMRHASIVAVVLIISIPLLLLLTCVCAVETGRQPRWAVGSRRPPPGKGYPSRYGAAPPRHEVDEEGGQFDDYADGGEPEASPMISSATSSSAAAAKRAAPRASKQQPTLVTGMPQPSSDASVGQTTDASRVTFAGSAAQAARRDE